MEACPFANDGCKYYNGPRGCYVDKHHLQYPRNIYTTHVEKIFRSLPENVVELPRCVHDEIHATEPAPLKPSIEVMREAINAERMRRDEPA